MTVGVGRSALLVALVAFVAAPLLAAVASPPLTRAQEVVCPAGMYWDVYTDHCLYYDVDVYLGPNPILGPAGPIGVGGVVGPVGPGPVGPGPIGPGRR